MIKNMSSNSWSQVVEHVMYPQYIMTDTPYVLVFVTLLNIIQPYKLANARICEFFFLFGNTGDAWPPS